MLTGATQNKIKIKLWNAKQKSNKYWKFDTWITLKFKKTIHNLVSNATTEKFFFIKFHQVLWYIIIFYKRRVPNDLFTHLNYDLHSVWYFMSTKEGTRAE